MTTTQKCDIDFFISSSWDLDCKSNLLRNAVTLSASNKSVDLEDVVQLDTCVHLIQSGENSKDSCSVTVAVPKQSMQLLSHVVIVSEARILELFGGCGEYLTTCTAEYIDDFEDCAVYMADCTVKASSELLIKFQKTKHEDSLWIYGIHLQLYQNKRPMPSLSSINFQSVNDILKEAKVPLSENAEKCKSFLQAYGGALDNSQLPHKSKMPNPQTLVKMLEAGYFQPLGETGKNVSKCISDFVPFLTRDVESKRNTCSGSNSSAENSEMTVLKDHIDQRFSQLESRIDRFEQKMKELEIRQSEKLDSIIALLNKSNS